MEYRKLPHGEEQISVIGMGSSVVGEQKEKDIIQTVQVALEQGVNFFDMAGGHSVIFPAYGKALQGQRDKALLQVHFGADYTSGEYGWTTSLEAVKRSVDWQLKMLKTDYIDFGFIHCLDEKRDLEIYERNGVLDYLLQMKEQGVVRHIGLSTHAPELAYLDATPEERDYSIIGSFTPDDAVGKCVYCRHCHPCPAGMDIGLINKYYDLSVQGDILATEHYETLEKRASDCIACGHCDSRCPFQVKQTERMREIAAYFGC